MELGSARMRWGVALAALAAFALGALAALNDTSTASGPVSPALPKTAEAASAPAAVPEADYRIEANGRLTIEASSLPAEGSLSLALALPDDARNAEPRPARVVAGDGRQIETRALDRAGSGSGVQLDIDASWLAPGRYLIEVKTAERKPLPLRRYVLEVK